MENINTNNSYFPALTGLRAVAAFMVYFHHFNPIDKHIFGKAIFDFFSELHIGVTLFFVLSGFLITNRYYHHPKIDFKKYMINRFARIYPMYFLLTTLTFVFFAVCHSQSSFSDFKVYLLNITFLRGFFDAYKFTGIQQGWSLTVEETFYLLAPFLFIVIRKNKFFLIVLPIILLSFGFGLVYFFQNIDFYSFMKTNDFMLDFTFFGRCIEFFLGIGLAVFIKKYEILRFRFSTYFGIISICACVFLLAALKGVNAYGTDCLTGKIINTFWLPLLGVLPLFLGLIYEKTIISKVLGSGLFQLLGKSSYVFYLIHMGIFVTLLNKISGNYLFLFLALNSISVLLYQYIEAPLNIFFRSGLKR